MTSPSIRIRIINAGNISVPGHMFVVLNDGSGNVTPYGYYPNVRFPGGVFGGPGKVRENFDREEHEFITDSPSLNTGAPNVTPPPRARAKRRRSASCRAIEKRLLEMLAAPAAPIPKSPLL